jgi:hypothetical protein
LFDKLYGVVAVSTTVSLVGSAPTKVDPLVEALKLLKTKLLDLAGRLSGRVVHA